jgi:hypothetical protein
MIKVKNVEFNVNFACALFVVVSVAITSKFQFEVDFKYFPIYRFELWIAEKVHYYWQLMMYSDWMKSCIMLLFRGSYIYFSAICELYVKIKSGLHYEVMNPHNVCALSYDEKVRIAQRLKIFPSYVHAAVGIVMYYISFKFNYGASLIAFKFYIAKIWLIHLA